MKRKVNRYFVTIPVGKWEHAQQIGSETNWIILQTLRDAGIDGCTVNELAKKTNISKSTIYNVLSKLRAGEWVESERRRFGWGRPKKEVKERLGGKPARVYIEKVPWGDIEFDDDFLENLPPVSPLMDKYKNELSKIWLAFLDEIVTKFKTDKDLEKFFPKDAIHEACGWSHEAREFLYAISYLMIEELLDDDDFEKLARKHKFMK